MGPFDNPTERMERIVPFYNSNEKIEVICLFPILTEMLVEIKKGFLPPLP